MVVLNTANRYAFSKSHKQRRFSLLIILGISFGMAALIIIIGIMNSLQTSQLSRIRNVESFDISISNSTLSKEELMEINQVQLAFYYQDISAYAINNDNDKSSYIRLRGIEKSLFEHPRFQEEMLNFSNLDKGFLLGNQAASDLGVYRNSVLKVSYLKSGKAARLVPFNTTITIDDLFYSSNSDFSSTTCLLSLDKLYILSGNETHSIGLYLEDDNLIDSVKDEILKRDPDCIVRTWKDSNLSLYSALMLEKYMVIVFLGFIIIIVSFYLKKATRRLIEHKRKETAELRALGLTKRASISIFLVQAIEISLIGIVVGIASGLLISYNLSSILSLVDKLIMLVTGHQSIFSVFEFSVTIEYKEIIYFSLMILLCTFIFSLFGANEAFKINIMEILKDDTRK